MSNEADLTEEIIKQQEEINELRAMVNALRESLSLITKEDNIHPIKDWAICGICTNSSSGSEGRKSRMKVFYEFIGLLEGADEALDTSPTQCLAEVKADAVGDAMQKFRYDFEGARDTDSIEAFFDEIESDLRKSMIVTKPELSKDELSAKLDEELKSDSN